MPNVQNSGFIEGIQQPDQHGYYTKGSRMNSTFGFDPTFRTSRLETIFLSSKESNSSQEKLSPFFQITTSYPIFTYTKRLPQISLTCNESYLTPIVYTELDALSDDRAMTYMPVILFLILVMLFGVLGNLLVLYIYCSDSKRKPANNFIITMALFDFLASSIAIPLDIYDMRYHYTFYNRFACKAFRYSESAFTNASSFVLILIAIDRYLKICKPFLYDSPLRSKLMCCGATLFGFVIAIPSFWVFGINRKPVLLRKYCGFDCTVSDEYKKTKLTKVYYALLFCLFFLTVSMLVGFYLRIWIALRARRRITTKDHKTLQHSPNNSGPAKDFYLTSMKTNGNDLSSHNKDSIFSNGIRNGNFNRTYSCVSRNSRMSVIGSRITSTIGNVRCSRSTKIFIAVSIAFILCFLPSIAVNLLQVFMRNTQMKKTKEIKIIIKLFARVHFVNHAINPVIYSFLNIKFRIQCKMAFRRLITARYVKFCTGKSPIASSSSNSVLRKRTSTDSN
ncbi:thyrotropin-releasing hormone receptor-like [Saccostrea echinata]|uniref:thyrotropin-releasing hormone receptor-like n=1 Tax=Saccostrea echinata TaxID=191078 RepID=UPI002A7F6A4E|nr:thyrotropin-releasing hormone receptor-like [Saccostrea echinata]